MAARRQGLEIGHADARVGDILVYRWHDGLALSHPDRAGYDDPCL